MADAQNNLESKREAYVQLELELYEREEALCKEKESWSWSPLYKMLLSRPRRSGPQALWEHDEGKLAAILEALSLECSTESATLEAKCSHILRIFKLFFRSTFGPQSSLAHPYTGLIKERALAIAYSKEDSVRLRAFA